MATLFMDTRRSAIVTPLKFLNRDGVYYLRAKKKQGYKERHRQALYVTFCELLVFVLMWIFSGSGRFASLMLNPVQRVAKEIALFAASGCDLCFGFKQAEK